MPTREAVDLYAGHPGFDQRPTPRPVTDDDVCGREGCRHPRWMHVGLIQYEGGSSACHQQTWQPERRCTCMRFVEVDL